MRSRFSRRAAALGFVAATCAVPSASATLRATTGAAPGYVEDAICASCHEGIAKSYREVGMSRSFSRPRRGDAPEGAGGSFTHAASHRTYQMTWRGDRLIFRRHQKDADGAERNAIEVQVDWILGSGNHARTYLYRTPSGELFQLPVAWYAEENRFDMAPGYDRSDHLGIGRRVRRECMFCHNAYPDVAAGSDVRGAAQTFPADLPEGTGCQRCHGPGAEHTQLALRGAPEAELQAAIVNPAKLAPERRDDVCFQCHLQPSVAIPGIRRFGRADYSFRPGQALGDYLVPTDVEVGPAFPDRFEINHHPYRLRKSRCAAASGVRLSCLTCHDPHRKVPAAERAAHYRAACLGCHDSGALARGHEPATLAGGAVESADCVSCHMPKRRPLDVVHTVMTDHRIGIYRDRPSLVAPLEEWEPEVRAVEIYPLSPAPSGEDATWYRALAAATAGGAGVPSALEALDVLAERHPPRDLDPYVELAPAHLRKGNLPAAQRDLDRILAERPEDPTALGWLAVLRARQGDGEAALQILSKLAERSPDDAEVAFNYGRLLLGRRRVAEARNWLERATRSRLNFIPAWYWLAEACGMAGDEPAQEATLRRALEVDPGEGNLYSSLAAFLAARHRAGEAESLVRFGRTVARRPELVELGTGAPDEP